MPLVYRYLSVQFHIEHWRLRDFGQIAGLLEGSGNVLDASIEATSSLLLRVFNEIDEILKSFSTDVVVQEEGIAMGCGNHQGRSIADSYRSLIRPRLFTDHAINPSRAFQHLKWSLSRKDKFEQLLQRLKILNDFLYQLLGKQQAQMLQEKQRETNMALVQTQNSIKELLVLSKAAQITSKLSNTAAWEQQQQNLGLELGNLAAFKALYISLVESGDGNDEKMKVKIENLVFKPDNSNSSNERASLQVPGTDAKKVIINWRVLPESSPEPNETCVFPIQELLILLMAPKPTEFCIPPCLGYCEVSPPGLPSKLGFIFSNPPLGSQDQPPTTLIHAITTLSKPSLTERVALAYNLAHSLLYLHSVNWLHKGLRSENILLYSSTANDGKPTTTLPYLIGFESSRRSRFNENTSEVPRLGHQEVYRHPDIQVNGLGPKCYYRKTFDIYSLGIILLEIAHWKPIAMIMGIEDQIDKFPKATSGVRDRILTQDKGILVEVRREVGDRYASAVESCVLARDAFGVMQLDLETDTSTSLRIQEGYNAKVVKMLRGILV